MTFQAIVEEMKREYAMHVGRVKGWHIELRIIEERGREERYLKLMKAREKQGWWRPKPKGVQILKLRLNNPVLVQKALNSSNTSLSDGVSDKSN